MRQFDFVFRLQRAVIAQQRECMLTALNAMFWLPRIAASALTNSDKMRPISE